MTSPRLIPLTHLTILDVTGDDAQNFLHNQVPSDIRLLNPTRAQISGWCTAKGRLLTTFVIWPTETGYRLVLAADVAEAVAKRLKMFVLRLKVQITRSEAVVYGLLNPPENLGAIALPTDAWQLVQYEGITALRLDATRILLTGTESQFTALGSEFASGNLNDWLRSDIEQGFPLVTQATSEHYVPQMINLDKLGGVSFKKGCYPGQEIVARTHYLGKIKRHLYQVSAPNPLQAGSEVRSQALNGQACGSLLSTAANSDNHGWLALAVLQQDAINGTLTVGADQDVMTLTLIGEVLPDAA